jgi:hypothetical protein
VSKMPAQTPRTLPEPRYWEILENDIRGRYKVPKETCNTCEHGLECQVLNCQRIRDDLPISAFTFVSENPACYRPLGLLSRPNFADAIKFNYLWKSPAVPLGLKLKILAELSEKCLKIMTEKSLRAEKELANTPEVPAMAHRDYYNPEMLDAYKNANAITQHAFQAWGYSCLLRLRTQEHSEPRIDRLANQTCALVRRLMPHTCAAIFLYEDCMYYSPVQSSKQQTWAVSA